MRGAKSDIAIQSRVYSHISFYKNLGRNIVADLEVWVQITVVKK